VPGVLIAIAVGPAFRWFFAAPGYRESMLGVLTPGCLDSLGVGALLAIAAPSRSVALSLAAVPFAVIQMAQLAELALPAWLLAIKGTLLACVFGWCVVRAAAGFEGLTGRVLSSPPVVYVGRISYGVYLAHGFAGAMAASLFAAFGFGWPAPEPWRFIILCGVTVSVAAISWQFFEAPLNRLKSAFPYARATRSAALSPGRLAQPQAQE
jgi:peptidoglycan/LPS O-acetylase OafA/YrhL